MAKIRFKRSSHQALPGATATAASLVANTNHEQQHQIQANGTNENDDNKKSVVTLEPQKQQQPSDKRKTSSSFSFISSLTTSKHKQSKKQATINVSPQSSSSSSSSSTSSPSYSPPPIATTSIESTATTATTTTAGRFFMGKSKFKRSSISIATGGNASAPNTTTKVRTDHVQTQANVGQGIIKKTNSHHATTSTNASNRTVISTPLPPYEIEITDSDGTPYIECPLCVLPVSYASTPDLKTCGHRTCLDCMQRYLKTEINHSRLNITCPICSEPLLQNVIRDILNDDKFYFKYESFMLRKVLAAEPDARWCPAPDCGYAVLANGCASCPRLVCARNGCNTAFCYHCKQEWHPNQTCSAASIQRNKSAGLVLNALNISDLIEESTQTSNGQNQRKSSKSSQHNTTLRPEDIKECPVCSSRIIKMNDGSCNHMTCSICETEFCWLCMKEISDFHYFSPSGCTFWGKKPWSRKKKLLWRLGMLVGAPICIVFIAGIAVPAIVIGIPVWAARKLHTRLEKKQFSRYRKNAIITGGVLLSFIVSPIISAMALAVGIPILLGYVYGVVPLSLCRSSGGCLSASPSIENLHEQMAGTSARHINTQATDVVSIGTATSHKLGNPSIGETSLYMSNISLETNSIGHVTSVERDDRESASNAALAGSIISQNIADDGNSTRALAGSIISKDSNGYALIPVEIHSHNNPSTAAGISSTASIEKGSTSDRLDSADRRRVLNGVGSNE